MNDDQLEDIIIAPAATASVFRTPQQQGRMNLEGREDLHGDTLAQAATGKDASGRQPGARAWLPVENLVLITSVEGLSLTIDVPDTDQRWKTISATLLEKFKGAARSLTGIRDHFKDMVTQIRGMSMSYSTQASAIMSPRKGMDVDSEEFKDEFKVYAKALWDYYDITFKPKANGKWWDDVSFSALRLFLWKEDSNKSTPAGAVADTNRKFDAEQETKSGC